MVMSTAKVADTTFSIELQGDSYCTAKPSLFYYSEQLLYYNYMTFTMNIKPNVGYYVAHIIIQLFISVL